MSDLAAFSSGLRELIGDADGMRPLLCSGNPLRCTVALVGANPGRSAPFWRFWSDEIGVDKNGWLTAYLQEHGRFRRSRAAIERFVPLINGPVVELNAHAKQSPRLVDLGKIHRTTDVLMYVMERIRPRVAVCAGSDALRAVEGLGSNWGMDIVPAKHFIYWGRDAERELAARVNAVLAQPDIQHEPT